MKSGDRVRHKLAGIEMTVVRVSETIAVCKKDEPEMSKFGYEIWGALCLLENLEVVEQESKSQLSLFNQ